MKKKAHHWPLAVSAALFIGLAAVMAALGLRVLFDVYGRFVRSVSAETALQYGHLVTHRVAGEFQDTPGVPTAADIERFQHLASTLHRLEPRLEYVTIREHDDVLLHWQAPLDAAPDAVAGEVARVLASPRVLHLGVRRTPVIDFALDLPGADVGGERRLHLGLQRHIIDTNPAGTPAALTAMFRIALAMVGLAFAVCLLAVWMLVWREKRWMRRRELEDNLAFAGAVAGAVIHDFRNPMSAMRLDAQMLRNEARKGPRGSPDKLDHWAGRIEKTLVRMDDLLREFLELSAPARDDDEHFDVNACLSDCADLMKLRFENAGVELRLELAPAPLFVGGPCMQFKRAVLNIMGNACHFAPAGTSVTVASLRQGRHVKVEITDSGPGIPPADRRRVFDMFYSRRPGGTGIGLALARTAVENCGGRISVVQPETGRGCSLLLLLPGAAPHQTEH